MAGVPEHAPTDTCCLAEEVPAGFDAARVTEKLPHDE